HVFHFHYPEELAELLVGIADQFERKLHLCLETFVRLETVARDAEDIGVGLLEARQRLADVDTLGRAARRVVLRIEIQNLPFPLLCRRADVAACRLRLDRGDFAIDRDGHGFLKSRAAAPRGPAGPPRQGCCTSGRRPGCPSPPARRARGQAMHTAADAETAA